MSYPLSESKTDLHIVLALLPHFFSQSHDTTQHAYQDVRIHAPFVRFVDDDDTPVFDGAKKRRIGVLHDTPFERCREHELIDRGVSV